MSAAAPGPGAHHLLVIDPGHFHAALALRTMHPRLDARVFVYAPDGPDVDAFLAMVRAFNERPGDPTDWRPVVYRGADYLERAIGDRAGDVAILAGRNDRKATTIARLHAAGVHVLADKPLAIDGAGLEALRPALVGSPLLMELMTGRHSVLARALVALVHAPAVFGEFAGSDETPAISITGAHHLFKVVNGAPLRRPAWYFDVGVQGEGIMDVTTHQVDLVQRLAGLGPLEVLGATQWPTRVPRSVFAEITGLDDFPPVLRYAVSRVGLEYLCNAEIRLRAAGVPVVIESTWGLREAAGGGDTQRVEVRGTRATITLENSPATGFVSRLVLRPSEGADRLDDLPASVLAGVAPGLRTVAEGAGYAVVVPPGLGDGHEGQFAMVLDDFLGRVDRGAFDADDAIATGAKYELLCAARARSHTRGA